MLVTGATGFLGGAVAARLLESPDGKRSLFLVRGNSIEDARARLIHRLRSFGLAEPLLQQLGREQILLGDLNDTAQWRNDPRLRSVTHVIHSAAMASFGRSEGIWATNVDGTIALAKALQNCAQLERFVYVGTAMVCGADAPTPVAEDYVPEERPVDIVEYTISKREAEAALRRDFPLLPLVVARPSIVVGHTHLGCTPSGSIFWVFRLALGLGVFPCEFDTCIDVVPVDYVADALLMLAQKPKLAHDLYHVTSGETAACSFREIDVAMAAALGRPLRDDYRMLPYEEIALLQRDFENRLGPCNRRVMLRAIKTYGEFSALGLLFDNHRLLAEGMPPPPRFDSYAGVCAVTSAGQTIAEQMRADFK